MITPARSVLIIVSAILINFAFPPKQNLRIKQISPTPPEFQPVSQNQTSPSSKSLPRTNYIVRFIQYRSSEEHRSYLDKNSPSKDWDWIERRNPAANFPTDFALISVDNLAAAVLIEEFGELGLVKDVSADRSFTRSILTRESEDESIYVKKPPGKLFTPFSSSDYTFLSRRHLTYQKSQVTSLLGADVLWEKGHTGAKIKMAIFDTGIRADHPHFRNIKERTNWTNEDTLNDNLGHGTFVAGVIAGQGEECLGFAPDTEIYAFRVFTDAQVSYTSWFLDAFNYAIVTDMDVLNLSIGGPDFLDLPFVEKVWEVTANNIIMVSAIGNDGPLYGTLNNPADQSDVIGVGGIDYNDQIAYFSSRGMSTWELPHGYGRVKPDVVAYGREIMGSKISSGCKSLSGTSVASPVVAGVVCLLASVLPEQKRMGILNPASMKQALVEGATKLSGPNMFEQGAGRVDLLKSYEILREYGPRASIFPDILDYTDCPYFWPFCRQPLYASAMPVIFNTTILNGMGVVGYLESPPTWHPSTDEGNILSLLFTYSDVIWPWTGYLALHLQIKQEGASFSGEIQGNVTIQVYSPAGPGEKSVRRSRCTLRLKLKVVPTPPRRQRVLWDQFHSMKYPPGYIPRDSLDVRNDILDWHGDHLHTNFHTLFNTLRDSGYHVETLGSPLTCFDARRYGTLLLVDPEDEYFKEEVDKLRNDVYDLGFGLAVFADWYNVDTIVKMRFFDDNTRSWWTPVTGGANIPALNDLLEPYGIAFGDKILNGDFTFDGEMIRYASGANIVKFPPGGHVHSFQLLDSSESGARKNLMLTTGIMKEDSPILGVSEIGRGRVAVYGDSNCIDSSHMVTNCFGLLLKILDFTARNIKQPALFSDSARDYSSLYGRRHPLPSRRPDINFSAYSSVLGNRLLCGSDSRLEISGTKGFTVPGYPSTRLSSTPLNISLQQPTHNNHPLLSNTHFSFLYRDDEVDPSVPLTRHWLVLPVLVAVFGMMLLFSFFRFRLRRPRRRKVFFNG